MPPARTAPRVGLGREALAQLHVVLDRELPDQAPLLLREIGFAAGGPAYEGFAEWIGRTYNVQSPQELDAGYLGDALAGYWRDEGWGAVTTESLGPGLLAFDCGDWAEATPGWATQPACHFSTGVLSDFFTRLGDAPAAVMEVECRSGGGARCRFLVGSPEVLTWLYDGTAGGAPIEGMIASLRGEPPA
jgi:predicted hydrocarbon binding protein